jgi:FKBP-type peptidyl-prolyl cis-trans isomerase FklB
MKNKIAIALLLLIPCVAFSQQKQVLKNEIDSISYGMGMAIGMNFKSLGMNEFNEKLFMQAMNEIVSGKETILKMEQTQQLLNAYFTKLQSKKGAANIAAGRKFLEENKTKPGVVTLPSGLQYIVVKDGVGVSPTINDKVTCHYHGTLINGKVFDSSVDRGQPIQFAVNGVIAGWTEALQLMKPGSKWKLFIPSELAYGDQQKSQDIEANSVLIFDVELISVDK